MLITFAPTSTTNSAPAMSTTTTSPRDDKTEAAAKFSYRGESDGEYSTPAPLPFIVSFWGLFISIKDSHEGDFPLRHLHTSTTVSGLFL